MFTQKIISYSEMSSVFRHNTNPELAQKLKQFAQQNRYFDRKLYKENWKKWCEDHEELITEEERSLREHNYTGDVVAKLYKSARYYYSKKSNQPQKEPVKRRKYVSIGNIIITAMDDHIKTNINNKDYSPAFGYDTFCKSNTDLLRSEIKSMCDSNETLTNKDISLKFKKTYKNRYFLQSRNCIKINEKNDNSKKIDSDNTED